MVTPWRSNQAMARAVKVQVVSSLWSGTISVQALLEAAVAQGFRHHIDVFGEMGHEARRILASDGGTKSRSGCRSPPTSWQSPCSFSRIPTDRRLGG
jgi:hypothetical protein